MTINMVVGYISTISGLGFLIINPPDIRKKQTIIRNPVFTGCDKWYRGLVTVIGNTVSPAVVTKYKQGFCDHPQKPVEVITGLEASYLAQLVFDGAKNHIEQIQDWTDRTGNPQLHKTAIEGLGVHVHVAKKCRYGFFVSVRVNDQYNDQYGVYVKSHYSAIAVKTALQRLTANYHIDG